MTLGGLGGKAERGWVMKGELRLLLKAGLACWVQKREERKRRKSLKSHWKAADIEPSPFSTSQSQTASFRMVL